MTDFAELDFKTALSDAVAAMFDAITALDAGDVTTARAKLEAAMTCHGEMLIEAE